MTDMTAKVPTRETGMAMVGTSVARQFCRKSQVMRITQITASMRVSLTSSMEASMKSVVS